MATGRIVGKKRLIERRELSERLGSTLRRAGRDRVTTNAASLSFHWFLAIVPAGIALTGLASLAGLSHRRVHQLIHGASVLLPVTAARTIEDALTAPTSRGSDVLAVVIGALVSFWAALQAAVALQLALDMAYETSGDRSFVGRRVRGLVLIAVTVLFGGGAFMLLIVGGPLAGLIDPGRARAFLLTWTILRWVVGIACVVALISLYDYLGPNKRQRKWRLLSIGGAFSTALWLLIAEGYSFYLDHFSHSAATYGSLAGVVVLEVWLYLSALVVLLGAELNRELELAEQNNDTKASSANRVRAEAAR